MIERVAPPYSTRRLALDLTRDVLRRPGSARRRINLRNLHHWRAARGMRVTCIVCGHEGHLLDEMLDVTEMVQHRIAPIQETLRCRSCGSRVRDRLFAAAMLDALVARAVIAPTIAALAEVLPSHIRILVLDPSSALAPFLAGHPGFVCAVQEPGSTGEVDHEGVPHVDLSHLPFRDRSFHFIVASDALEHVRSLHEAHREVSRCLREIGMYMFTATYDAGVDRTSLVDAATGELIAGGPALGGLESEDLPAYRIFGRDLLEDLDAAGLAADLVAVRRPDIGVPSGGVFRAVPSEIHHELDGRALPRQGGSSGEGGSARPSTTPLMT